VSSWRYLRLWPWSLVELSEEGVRFVTPLRGERRYPWDAVASIDVMRGTLFVPVPEFLFRIEGGEEIWVGPWWPPAFRRLLYRCAPPGVLRVE
jgi:hypothetical protein